MKPVELNFQTRQPLVDRFFWGTMIFLVLLAGTLTLMNTTVFFSNEAYLDILKKQIEQKKMTSEKKTDFPPLKQYTPRQIESLKSEFQYLKNLLKKDMFPLSQFLDAIEMAIPKSIIINELALNKGDSSLLLKGESPDAASVAAFLNGLKASRKFSIDFNKGSVVGGSGFSFEIIAHWKWDDV
ncbi:hypothetical protein SAMN02746065_10365 [Desulfocicer vacuolatum DSM 3385]|uniref:Type IV pilus assembly protein PilN n=1 Tax=Desulfocicer vacuolatum DSM 3385 TaxID=1121400 RepID=A0A1W1ZNU2_9BACT|nr:PilN domain-containing protein [Desulfocicer vacuolatum]SMC50044.1 hypothetical protein SAMN02746065_10365 [Desulfocicer vacuolatum DSM 3385]